MKQSLGLSTALISLAAAGVLAASLLTPAASAWDLYSLPAPCSITSHVFDSSGPANSFTIRCGTDQKTFLYGANDYPSPPTNPNFQSDLDAFVNANYTAPTTTKQTTTTVTTTVVITTPAAPASPTTAPATTTQPANTTTSAAPTASAPPTPTVSTVTVTTATDLAAALTLIQQRLDWLEYRVKALEDQVGQIIGEEKNETPFTNPA